MMRTNRAPAGAHRAAGVEVLAVPAAAAAAPRGRLRRAAFSVAALAALATAAAYAPAARAESVVGAPPAGRVALVGGTVHPASGPALEVGTVVFRAGRIESVAPGATAPPDAEVVDCRGRHVWPGMISANTVLGMVEIGSVRGTQDSRELGQVNPNIRAEVQVNPDSDHLPVTRLGGVTRALSVPRGGALSGTSALIGLMGWTWEDLVTRAPVALHVQWPAMTPGRGGVFGPPRPEEARRRERDEALAALRTAFDDARAYWKAQDAAAAKAAPRHDRDAKWDAMRLALAGEIPVAFHADRLEQIRAALAFADDQGLKRVILVGGHDAPLVAGELERRGVPVIVGGTLALPLRTWEPYDAAFTVPARLAATGVTYAIADDGGSSMNERNLGHHAAMAAAFGLPREEALRAVTLYPARILGVDDRLGSIEPGKLADLVVSDGDLLDVTTAIERVWIGGVEVPPVSRQTRLFEKYDSRPRGAKARPR